MATPEVTQLQDRRKPFAVVQQSSPRLAPPTRDAEARHDARLCPTPHLTVDQYVRLLACVEREGGVATLDEVARDQPTVERPVSAVLDLCDAGILSADLAAALDGDTRVWRVDR